MTQKNQLKQLLANTNALLEAMRFSIQSAVGPDDIWKYSSSRPTAEWNFSVAVPFMPAGSPHLANHDTDSCKGYSD